MSVGNHSFVIFMPGQSELAVVGFDSVLLVAALVSEGASIKNVMRKGPLVFMTQALKATLLRKFFSSVALVFQSIPRTFPGKRIRRRADLSFQQHSRAFLALRFQRPARSWSQSLHL